METKRDARHTGCVWKDSQPARLTNINYLKHDYIASLEAVDHAIKNGDENTSVHNLQRLINQQLANDKKL